MMIERHGRIPCRFRVGSLSGEGQTAGEVRVADQKLRVVRSTVRVAQEVGPRLAHGQILFGALPAGEAVVW